MRYRTLLALLAVLCVYARVLAHPVHLWLNSPELAHGAAVPLFSLFVVYHERKRLEKIQPTPSWTGTLIVLLAVLMLLIGVLRPISFRSQISFWLVLAGVIVQLEGWAFFRAVLFPWAFLVLMFPIPFLTGTRFELSLESLSGQLAMWLQHLSRFATLLPDNVIAGPEGLVLICVAGPLLLLLTVAIIYGYFGDARMWVRVLLAILVFPIEVVRGSVVLIIAASLAGYAGSGEELGFVIRFSGWVGLFVALLMLIISHRLISLVCRRSGGNTSSSDISQLKAVGGLRVSG
jgi:hypothetical protein